MSKFLAVAEQKTREAVTKRATATALSQKEAMSADEQESFDALIVEAKFLEAEAAAARARHEALAENDAAIAAASRPAPRQTAHPGGEPMVAREGWRDDPKRGFKDIRSFLSSVQKAAFDGASKPLASLRPSPSFVAGAGDVQATAGSDEHSTFNDASLGFMVPTALLPGMQLTAVEADPFPDTLKIPMPTGTVEMAARTDKNHSTSVSGGLRVYRRAESGTVTASRVQVEKVRMTAHPLMGVTYETEELLQDAPGVAMALIEAGFRDEFRGKRDEEILNGTGAGEYLGINNSGIAIDVAKETGQAADTIVFENLVKMLARLWGRGRWVASPTCIPTLAKMNAGTNGLVWQASAREGVPGTLLGLPISYSERCAAVGDVGDILLVNMSQYLEGTRQDLLTEESIHVRFLENERTFRFTMRTGGAPWWRSVLTPKRGDTLSPFVRLAAR